MRQHHSTLRPFDDWKTPSFHRSTIRQLHFSTVRCIRFDNYTIPPFDDSTTPSLIHHSLIHHIRRFDNSAIPPFLDSLEGASLGCRMTQAIFLIYISRAGYTHRPTIGLRTDASLGTPLSRDIHTDRDVRVPKDRDKTRRGQYVTRLLRRDLF